MLFRLGRSHTHTHTCYFTYSKNLRAILKLICTKKEIFKLSLKKSEGGKLVTIGFSEL